MSTSFALFNMGGGEIILVLALILILYGARKLPESAKGLAADIEEFGREKTRRHKWRKAEIVLLLVLIGLTIIELLAVGKWLLQ
jgi:hypothetical protein